MDTDETRSIENPSVPLSDKNIAAYIFGSRSAASGVTVNEQTALSIPAFQRGVSLIAGTCARVPIPVYKHRPDGSKERDKKHPAYRLLKRQPNPYQTALEWLHQLVMDAVVCGNGYSVCIRN